MTKRTSKRHSGFASRWVFEICRIAPKFEDFLVVLNIDKAENKTVFVHSAVSDSSLQATRTSQQSAERLTFFIFQWIERKMSLNLEYHKHESMYHKSIIDFMMLLFNFLHKQQTDKTNSRWQSKVNRRNH